MSKPDNGLNEELRDLSPLLGNLWEERDKILPPPPHYFDHLSDEVMANLRLQNLAVAPNTHRGTPRIGVIGRCTWPLAPIPLAAAALILLATASTWFFLARYKDPMPCAQLDCLQASEVQEYVQGNLYDFPLELILDIKDAEKALQKLTLTLPLDSTAEDLSPILIDALQQLDAQEIESLF